MTATIPLWGTDFDLALPKWGDLPTPEELERYNEPEAVEQPEENPFRLPTVDSTTPPDPEPVGVPLRLSNRPDALAIVIRSEIVPSPLFPFSWWTPAAVDGEEWDGKSVEIGYSLKEPVWVEDIEGRSPHRPEPEAYYWGMARIIASRHGGRVVMTYKNPDAEFRQFPVTKGRSDLYELKDLRDVFENFQDRQQFRGQSRSAKKSSASRKNLEVARKAKGVETAIRYERVLEMVGKSMSVSAIAESENLTPATARKTIQRAKKWKGEQE